MKKRRASPRTAKASPRRSAPKKPEIFRGARLGHALKVIYRHANGKVYQHKFAKGTSLGVLEGNRYLVIGPVEIQPFIV